MSGLSIKLYRAVSVAERTDIQVFGGFRSIPSAMHGHWFAETASDAATWGQRLYQVSGQPFVVVEVEVPSTIADGLFRLANLDNIGPARFADDNELGIINQTKVGPIQATSAAPPGNP